MFPGPSACIVTIGIKPGAGQTEEDVNQWFQTDVRAFDSMSGTMY